MYGFECRSATDESVLLNSESINSYFMGFATMISYTSPHSSGEFKQYGYIFEYSLPLTDATKYPLIFTNSTYTGRYTISAVWHDDTTWKAKVYTDTMAVYPALLVFAEATSFTIGSDNYGMALFDSNGNKTFDSRWNKKILIIKDLIPIISSPGNSYTITSGLTYPAFAHRSIYQKIGPTYSWYYYRIYLNLLGIDGTALSFSEFQIYDWPCAGDTNSSDAGTWGDNESTYVPIIDANDYT